MPSGGASPNFLGGGKKLGGKYLSSGEQECFCLEPLLSKHKMTRYAKNGGHDPCTPWLRLCLCHLYWTIQGRNQQIFLEI